MSEHKEVVNTPQHSGITGMVLVTLALAITAGAFAYGYMQLYQVNTSLSTIVSQLREQVAHNEKNVTAVQKTLQGNAEQAQAITNFIAAQQGNISKARVIEALSLTRLASDQLNLRRDAVNAYVNLKHAQEILQQVPDPALEAIRQALAANIESLNAAQQFNIEEAQGRLLAMSNAIDQLPLLPTPLQYTKETHNEPDSNLPWWKKQWHKTMDALRKIVIVRYDGANNAPLILPEEKNYLLLNLHAQIEEVSLSLLNHHASAYYAGLARLRTWIQKYFVQDAPATQAVLTQIAALQAINNISPPQVDLSATVQLFDQYLAQNNNPQPTVTQ